MNENIMDNSTDKNILNGDIPTGNKPFDISSDPLWEEMKVILSNTENDIVCKDCAKLDDICRSKCQICTKTSTCNHKKDQIGRVIAESKRLVPLSRDDDDLCQNCGLNMDQSAELTAEPDENYSEPDKRMYRNIIGFSQDLKKQLVSLYEKAFGEDISRDPVHLEQRDELFKFMDKHSVEVGRILCETYTRQNRENMGWISHQFDLIIEQKMELERRLECGELPRTRTTKSSVHDID